MGRSGLRYCPTRVVAARGDVVERHARAVGSRYLGGSEAGHQGWRGAHSGRRARLQPGASLDRGVRADSGVSSPSVRCSESGGVHRGTPSDPGAGADRGRLVDDRPRHRCPLAHDDVREDDAVADAGALLHAHSGPQHAPTYRAALRAVADLSNYDFVEDLSVNSLGHIFEQSISDLEEVKAEVHESKEVDKALTLAPTPLSRRKKDGIYYTPDYVVRYIIDNTLGAYLREHEEQCKLEFKLTEKRLKERGYELRERRAYIKYQELLQSVKLLDPACGSVAVQVLVR